MKMGLVGLGDVIKIIGVACFILRSFISTVQPNEPFARDLFGFPILEPGLEVTNQTWILSLVGAAIPFIFILVGYGVQKVAKRRTQYYAK